MYFDLKSHILLWLHVLTCVHTSNTVNITKEIKAHCSMDNNCKYGCSMSYEVALDSPLRKICSILSEENSNPICCSSELMNKVFSLIEGIIPDLRYAGFCEYLYSNLFCDSLCSSQQGSFFRPEGNIARFIYDESYYSSIIDECKSSKYSSLLTKETGQRLLSVIYKTKVVLESSSETNVANFTAYSKNIEKHRGRNNQMLQSQFNIDFKDFNVVQKLTSELENIQAFPQYYNSIGYYVTASFIFFAIYLTKFFSSFSQYNYNIKAMIFRQASTEKSNKIIFNKCSSLSSFRDACNYMLRCKLSGYELNVGVFSKTVIGLGFIANTLALCFIAIFHTSIDLRAEQFGRVNSHQFNIKSYYEQHFPASEFVSIFVSKHANQDTVLTADNLQIIYKVIDLFESSVISHENKSFKFTDFCQLDYLIEECYSRHVLKYLNSIDYELISNGSGSNASVERIRFCLENDIHESCMWKEIPIHSLTVADAQGIKENKHDTLIILFKMDATSKQLLYFKWIGKVKSELDKLRMNVINEVDVLYAFPSEIGKEITSTIKYDTNMVIFLGWLVFFYILQCQSLLKGGLDILKVFLSIMLTILISTLGSLAAVGLYVIFVSNKLPLISLVFTCLYALLTGCSVSNYMYLRYKGFSYTSLISNSLILCVFSTLTSSLTRSTSQLMLFYHLWYFAAIILINTLKISCWKDNSSANVCSLLITQKPRFELFNKFMNKWSKNVVKNKFYAAITSIMITICVFVAVDVLSKINLFQYDDDQFGKAKYSALPSFIAKAKDKGLISTQETFVFTDCLKYDRISFLNQIAADRGATVHKLFSYLTSKGVVFLNDFPDWLGYYQQWSTNINCFPGLDNIESTNSTVNVTHIPSFLSTISQRGIRHTHHKECILYKEGITSTIYLNNKSQVSAFMHGGLTKTMKTFYDIVVEYKQATKIAEVLSQSLQRFHTDKCNEKGVPPVFAFQYLHFLADSFVDIEKCFTIMLLVPGLICLVFNMTLSIKPLSSSITSAAAIASNLLLFGGLIGVFKFNINPINLASLPFIVITIVSIHESIWSIQRESNIEALLANDPTKLVFYLHRRAIVAFLIPQCLLTAALYFFETQLIQKMYQTLLCADIATIVTIFLMQPRRTRKWRTRFK
ncbi:hypothetical protein GJ496_005883 [Pomphorhynchus laevis]|nr:hypothetical protein GJ496_005883 [Pomphorhynchus laevis]